MEVIGRFVHRKYLLKRRGWKTKNQNGGWLMKSPLAIADEYLFTHIKTCHRFQYYVIFKYYETYCKLNYSFNQSVNK